LSKVSQPILPFFLAAKLLIVVVACVVGFPFVSSEIEVGFVSKAAATATFVWAA
jgi:uncharacterized membrane protein